MPHPRTDDRKAWPFGRPTRVCSTCHGTGIDRARVAVYETSRVDLGARDDDRAARIVCARCEGRGRELLAPGSFAPGH